MTRFTSQPCKVKGASNYPAFSSVCLFSFKYYYEAFVMCAATSDILIFFTHKELRPQRHPNTLFDTSTAPQIKKQKKKLRNTVAPWFMSVQLWHQHCPPTISFPFAIKWFYFFKHISHVDSCCIMYDCVHQLCNAIQGMTIYNLFDPQSFTLFNQKLFL